LAAGDERVLALGWQADPRAKGLTFSPDQAWAVHSPAWLPTRLDPAQRATLKLTLTMPEGLDLVPGQYFEHRGDGLVRATLTLSTPSSPSHYAFAVGHFRKSYYYGPGFGLSAIGPADADLVGAIELILPVYQTFRERLGATGAHGHSQLFLRGNPSQEALGMSLLSEDALRAVRTDPDPAEEWSFAHALAHQWFGVRIPCAGVTDLWLSEGFATFMVGVMKERRWGHVAYEHEVASWHSRLQALRGRDAPLALSRTGRRGDTDVTEAQLRARGIIYYRGALVLDKLRHELGEQTFWDGVRRYVEQQTGKPTRTEDLQNALQETSGRDLTAFFDRWVYASAPEL
jgi:hypothetical protein